MEAPGPLPVGARLGLGVAAVRGLGSYSPSYGAGLIMTSGWSRRWKRLARYLSVLALVLVALVDFKTHTPGLHSFHYENELSDVTIYIW